MCNACVCLCVASGERAKPKRTLTLPRLRPHLALVLRKLSRAGPWRIVPPLRGDLKEGAGKADGLQQQVQRGSARSGTVGVGSERVVSAPGQGLMHKQRRMRSAGLDNFEKPKGRGLSSSHREDHRMIEVGTRCIHYCNILHTTQAITFPCPVIPKYVILTQGGIIKRIIVPKKKASYVRVERSTPLAFPAQSRFTRSCKCQKCNTLSLGVSTGSHRPPHRTVVAFE